MLIISQIIFLCLKNVFKYVAYKYVLAAITINEIIPNISTLDLIVLFYTLNTSSLTTNLAISFLTSFTLSYTFNAYNSIGFKFFLFE
jgi:hypothetical protein